MEEIIKYKCVYQLRTMAVSKGGKISQLFGRTYLTWTKIWPTVKESIRLPAGVEQNELDMVLRVFEQSLLDEDTTYTTATDTAAHVNGDRSNSGFQTSAVATTTITSTATATSSSSSTAADTNPNASFPTAISTSTPETTGHHINSATGEDYIFSDKALVWAVDFNEVLRKRQELRKLQVDTRVQEDVSAPDTDGKEEHKTETISSDS
jgi:hypothetical protein